MAVPRPQLATGALHYCRGPHQTCGVRSRESLEEGSALLVWRPSTKAVAEDQRCPGTPIGYDRLGDEHWKMYTPLRLGRGDRLIDYCGRDGRLQ